MKPGLVLLETGEIFKGLLLNPESLKNQFAIGELVFNTSHSGYQEIASDPSYYNQILVTTFPLQGTYGIKDKYMQSKNLWIKALICLEMQSSFRDRRWLEKLTQFKIPVLSFVDTRSLVLRLRTKGVVWGGIFLQENVNHVKTQIKQTKKHKMTSDWTKNVSTKKTIHIKGQKKSGPRIAIIDFGMKHNILYEIKKKTSDILVLPSNSSVLDIKDWEADGVLLSNGPGDPAHVKDGIQLVKKLLSWKPIFGICMGHQVLALALEAKTYKLKFGHRGSNHPIKDKLLNRIYISVQNHGYSVVPTSLPKGVHISHINLNDQTVAGIYCKRQNCLGVQFHPEYGPGPHEASRLFDFFIDNMM